MDIYSITGLYFIYLLPLLSDKITIMFNNTYKKIKEGFVGQRMIVLPPDIKKSVVKNELIKRFYLTAIGYYPKAVNHDRERKMGSAQYILLYCVEGMGYITIQGKEIELKPNTYFIIPKNVAHHYRSSIRNPWSIYWVHFIGEHADLLYQRHYEQKKLECESIPYEEQRIVSFNEIYELLENSFDIREIEIINIKIMNFISSFIFQKEIDPTLQEKNVITDSINFMKKNLNRSFTLEELAERQHLSVSHYCRLFLAKTGRSPHQYFNQLKIQKSCQYLYFSDRNIKEICAELGFDDPYYFSRLFKKLMGLSPAYYKNQHKKV
ncbi:MAG: helix-turn-helix-domain containing protein AraC type [Mucilaginibacter sp.]|nr:helix-turn-helix-domain containing protein AraC type [Mucilaginibacter sp.]